MAGVRQKGGYGRVVTVLLSAGCICNSILAYLTFHRACLTLFDDLAWGGTSVLWFPSRLERFDFDKPDFSCQ